MSCLHRTFSCDEVRCCPNETVGPLSAVLKENLYLAYDSIMASSPLILQELTRMREPHCFDVEKRLSVNPSRRALLERTCPQSNRLSRISSVEIFTPRAGNRVRLVLSVDLNPHSAGPNKHNMEIPISRCPKKNPRLAIIVSSYRTVSLWRK